MPQYVRKKGENDVYDISGQQPRYIPFEEAQKGNIWGQIQDVTGDILKPEQALELPDPIQEPNYQASVSAIPTMGEIMTPEQPTKTEQNQTDMQSRVLQLYQQMGGQPAAQITAEKQAGLPEYQKSLTDINSQIQSLQKEALAIPMQIQQEAQGRGVTAAGVAPIQTGKLRENSIKALGLSAIAQTLQGNISTAQATANRTVELEFAPKQAEIDYLTKALDINMQMLNREDQKKAEQQKVLLQERQRLLDNQKEDKSIILGWAATAAKNGAPAVVLSQASQLSDPNQALALLSQYFVNPAEQEAALADLEYKRMQTKVAESGIETEKQKLELDKLKTAADIAATKAQTALGWAKLQAEKDLNEIESKKVSDAATPTPEKITEQKNNLEFLSKTVNDALKVSGASGRSGIRKWAEGTFIGSTDYTALTQYTDTLRTNLLTLATDPDIKKFFGPQMSNADVRLMQAAASTLNPETLNSSQMQKELNRVKEVFQRLSDSLTEKTGTYNIGDVVESGGKKYKIINSNGDVEEIK